MPCTAVKLYLIVMLEFLIYVFFVVISDEGDAGANYSLDVAGEERQD